MYFYTCLQTPLLQQQKLDLSRFPPSGAGEQNSKLYSERFTETTDTKAEYFSENWLVADRLGTSMLPPKIFSFYSQFY